MTILTTIKWEEGLPLKSSRYLIQTDSGVIVTDFYSTKTGWDKYLEKDVIRWTNLYDLENELKFRGTFNKYKESMEEFSNVMSNSSFSSILSFPALFKV